MKEQLIAMQVGRVAFNNELYHNDGRFSRVFAQASLRAIKDHLKIPDDEEEDAEQDSVRGVHVGLEGSDPTDAEFDNPVRN